MSHRFLLLLVAASPLLSTFSVPQPTSVGENAVDGSWLARAQRQIAAREYHASENGEGLQAPNRAHDLRTYFDAKGIRVHGRTAGASSELLRLSLAGVGRGDALVAAGPATQFVADAGRVEILRPDLVEWYVNSEAGLEQGFTLAKRPAGQGGLIVELSVANARFALLGDAVVFESDAGRKLRYGALLAFDARQRPLAAHFEVASTDRLRLVVDDSDATYPVVIDPLLTETADTQIQSTTGLSDFGQSAAPAGDVNGDGYGDMIVGAPNYGLGTGAAFVYLGSATGIASGGPLDADAVLTSTQFVSMFGASVASAGDVNGDGYADVIVGAYGYDAGQGFQEGAAFVYLGGPAGIASGNESTAATRLESNQAGAALGTSVASAGDVNGDGYADVIVGAVFFDNLEADEGGAFIFLGSASGIANGHPGTAATQLESNQPSAAFGQAVASAGDVNSDGYSDVIVGASNYDNLQTDEGAAFVFLGGPSGVAHGDPGTAATRLESNQTFGGGGNAPAFGVSVASAGDVNGDGYADVIVGAPSYDNPELDEGAAFVFLGSASGIAHGDPTTAATVFDSNQLGPSGGGLGRSVASAGDVNGDHYADVIVGTPYYNAGQQNEGVASVFLGSATGIASGTPETALARLEANEDFNYFGTSVASAGDVNGDGYSDVVAGAPEYGPSDEGAAFVYLGGGLGIADGDSTTAAARFESNETGAMEITSLEGAVGARVAGAGDVNGDGYADLIIGAHKYDAGQVDEGAAFIFLGSASGISGGSLSSAATRLESNLEDSRFGTAVAGAGDVNGDGYGDVVVGAELETFVFHGSASGIPNGDPTTAATRLTGVGRLEVGMSLAGAGDVNGDGYGDVIVGAPGYSSGQAAEGGVFVFHGSATGIPDGNAASAAWHVESNQITGLDGIDVAGAGDVNGDGYADVLYVSLPFVNIFSGMFEPRVRVAMGSAAGLGPPALVVAVPPHLNASASVAGAGDVNGDGYADAIVGSVWESSAFIYEGGASGLSATAATQLEDPPGLGWDVGGAGDVNGDGYADVIVGAADSAAFVFLGSAAGIPSGDADTTAAALLESTQADARFAHDVGSAGDVNGDGYADVIVSAPNYDQGQPDEGAVFLYLGNGNASGKPIFARQRRGDGSGIRVQPWGASHSTTGFAVELRAYHPDGTGRVRAEWEACPPAVPFGHASCTHELFPGWISVNAAFPSILLSRTFTSLTNGTLYRWRGRALHAPATGAIPANPAHGPWRRYQAQSVEADVRVIPEPGLVLSLVSGVALLATLARRRLDRG